MNQLFLLMLDNQQNLMLFSCLVCFTVLAWIYAVFWVEA